MSAPTVPAVAADASAQMQRVESLAQQTRVSEERILDEIMGRLGRIESTTADIRSLIENMPVAGAPATPASLAATPAAVTAQPAPVCPKPPAMVVAEPDDDATSLPVSLIAGTSAALALLLGLLLGRRRKPTPVSPSIAAHSRPPAATAEPARDELPLWQPTAKTGGSPPSSAPTPKASAPKPSPSPAPASGKAVTASKPVAAPTPVAAAAASDVHVLPTEVDQPGTAEAFDPTLELAEIMMSMGMASGAAQALEEHIRDNPRQALMHWLKLLDIYRKDGHRTDFEKAARELRKNFNIQAADWLGSGQPAPTLEDFKRVMEQVIALWHQPGECVDYLSHLLEDNRDGMRNGFPQSVAEEILLLTTIQRLVHPELAAAAALSAVQPTAAAASPAANQASNPTPDPAPEPAPKPTLASTQ